MKVYEDYDESKNRDLVRVDLDNLDIELRNHSLVTYDYGVYLAYANKNYSVAKAKAERRRKELSSEVRADPSEYGLSPPNLKDAIDEWVSSNKEVIELEDDVIEKKLIVDKLVSACNSLQTKSNDIGRGLKLLLRNYYMDNPVPDDVKKRFESMDYEEVYENLAKIMEKRRKTNEV